MSKTGTVAWFTANSSVSVTGMTVKTNVGSNLLIADVNGSNDPAESAFGSALNQSHSQILLEPVSTVNGTTFYYTTDAKGDGSAVSAAYTTYAEGDAFDTAYGVNETDDEADAYGYMDYTFYLKATSTEANKKISLDMCKMLYDGGLLTEKAWRVAVFASSGQATVTGLNEVGTTLKSILSPTGSAYFDGTAVSANNAKTAVGANLNAAATIYSGLGAGETKYFKVVTRLWLEGEDTTCNNATYANLTALWSLDLSIKLGDEDGVNHIAVSNADATASGANATVAVLDKNLTLAESGTYTWYNAATNVAIGSASTSPDFTNTGEAKDVYCVVALSNSTTIRSNTVRVAAA